ncbi:MAG: hypothetical protein ACOCTQ_05040, partial [Planctomycetota bacterium]
FQVPLLHGVYEGNLNDLTIFPGVVGDLSRRYSELIRQEAPVTLVCDKGCMGRRGSSRLR